LTDNPIPAKRQAKKDVIRFVLALVGDEPDIIFVYRSYNLDRAKHIRNGLRKRFARPGLWFSMIEIGKNDLSSERWKAMEEALRQERPALARPAAAATPFEIVKVKRRKVAAA
jgi:hypothetical protein